MPTVFANLVPRRKMWNILPPPPPPRPTVFANLVPRRKMWNILPPPPPANSVCKLGPKKKDVKHITTPPPPGIVHGWWDTVTMVRGNLRLLTSTVMGTFCFLALTLCWSTLSIITAYAKVKAASLSANGLLLVVCNGQNTKQANSGDLQYQRCNSVWSKFPELHWNFLKDCAFLFFCAG